jgi:micrococcal nuclease
MSRHKLFTRKTRMYISAAIILVVAIAQACGWMDKPKNTVIEKQPGLYPIARFVDGDTITVDMNGTKETIRMIGVDTPETHKPNTPVQCYGPEASAYTKNLIGNQPVRLQADPTNQNRDRYGRLLRYVYLPDGRLVQKEIINNGYGFAYTLFPFTKKDEFIRTEASAQQNAKGIWTNCTVTNDNGRKQTNNAK